MDVKLIKENPDGSADYFFDMNEEEKNSLLTLGIITAIKAGIEEGKKYVSGSEVGMGNTGCGGASCKDGTGEQSCESGQCSFCPKAP